MINIKLVNRFLCLSALAAILTSCGGSTDEGNVNENDESINTPTSPSITPSPSPLLEPSPSPAPTLTPTVIPEPSVGPAPAEPTPSPIEGPGARVDNPFRGAQFYIDPVWSAKAAAEPGGQAIAKVNTGVWVDRISAITEGMGLRGHLDEALAQGAEMVMIVLYNLPNRNCAALASSGELRITDGGFSRYQREYIRPIKAVLSDPLYADLRIVTIVEVDSLPNLVTNLSAPDCAEADGPGGYRDGIRYALNDLSELSNVYAYVDVSNAGLLGAADSFTDAANLVADVIESTDKGWSSVAGFVTNSANYVPTVEPFLTDGNQRVEGQSVSTASFYQGNTYLDEKSFAQGWREAMITRGAPETIGMLIDTGRNGWGGANRPVQQSTSLDIDRYVDESRIDRRLHRGNRCNQAAGLGFKPWADPYEGVDAFVWVKPPGESDGISDPNFVADPEAPSRQHNVMCNPDALSVDGSTGTGALARAPHEGTWFPEAFALLLENAYPDANEPAGPPPTPTPIPTSVPTPIPTPSPLASPSPLITPTPEATVTPIATPLVSPTPEVVPTPAPAVSPTPVVNPTPAVTPTPVAPTPTPVITPPPTSNLPLSRNNWVLSASSNEEELALAIDGDAATRWTTRQTQSDGDWFEIDFGENIFINRVELNSEESPNDYPINYGVFASEDGVTWGEALVTGEGDSIAQVDLPEMNTRFVRIEQYGTSARNWWSIHEINLFFSDDEAPIVTPTPVATPTNVPVPTAEPTPSPGVYPTDPFGDDPESVTVESNIGWVEGPTWVPDEGGFIYNLTDRNDADVHRIWRPGQDGTAEYWRVNGSNHGAIWSEGLIYMTNREPGRIGYIDPSTNSLEETVIRDGLGRPNDLDRFSDGSLYFSDWPRGDTGVYRLYLNGDMEQVISPNDIESPNGIAFTADCKRLYVVDSGESIVAFDVDDEGNLSNQRIHTRDYSGANGIAVDVAGNLYVPNGEGVRVFNPDGERVADWEGRGQGVVNMTFGGEDHRWLLNTNKTGVTAVRTLIPGGECNGLGTQRPGQ